MRGPLPRPAAQSECCRQAGGTDCLLSWADLAARHGILTLDIFDQGRSSGGSASRRGSLTTDGSDDSSGGASRAATSGPELLLPLRGRRLHKMLSIVREASEEGLLEELDTVEEETAEEGDADSQAAADEASSEAAAGSGAPAAADGVTQAAAATADEGAAGQCEGGGSSSSGAAMQHASDMLAAAAAAGLVPRPGAGCHLTLCSGDGSGSALLLHLDTIPFGIRYGEGLCCVRREAL